MNSEHLATYLNDHLAGSVAVLDLLAHLETAHANTDTGRFAAQLRADIGADRQELETLMERLHLAESLPRKAAAWLAEKATQLKLRLDDTAGGTLHLLETLDAVAVGIEGKRALWHALAAAAGEVSALRGIDYEALSARAVEQRRRVEAVRLPAAKAAFRG
ncbi:MAG: hypothetical protein H7Z75_19905 [Ferruginibacter sp.]|nr:hypothetical protein [Cytophagales bacterium]